MSKIKKLIICQVISIIALSVSIFLMPFVAWGEIVVMWKIVITGVIFWISLLLLIVFSLMATKVKKSAIRKTKDKNRFLKIGLFRFFRNKYAIVSDIAMVVSLLLFIFWNNIIIWQQLVFLFLSLFVLFFNFHWLFNGGNFEYLIYVRRKKCNED